MTTRNQLIACVIRQQGTDLYGAWVSLDKGHAVCLGWRQDETSAGEAIDHLLEIYREGRIKTPEDVLPHVTQAMHAQGLAAPLPAIGQGVGETAA
jgi:hypothetical protein